MSGVDRIAIVGASLAGLRTAEFLRRGGFSGSITLVGDEPHLPYDRPPLSKEVLRGQWDVDRIALRRKSYDALDLDLRLGRLAVELDASASALSLDDGSVLAFDRAVIATGGRVRTLVDQPAMEGLFTLRTLDDALAVRAALQRAKRVAVVGAGFIGAEVAASARQLGLEVTMVEALEAPLAASLGPEIGARLQRVHEDAGVDVRCGRLVAGFLGKGRVEGLALDDGSELLCDVVVVGIGVEPAVQWLKGSQLELENGVRCDSACQSSVRGIFAAGDVCNWYNPLFGERMRVEHWTNAVEQARHVAAQVLSEGADLAPFESVPMFWSDQFDFKIQGVGRPRSTDEVLVVGDIGVDGKLVALYGREGTLVGAVAFNRPPAIIKLRRLVAERVGLEAAAEIAEA